MPFAQVGGIKLHYEERGEGPETLLLVHGYGGGSARYAPVMDLLPPGIRCIAVDLRGAGESDRPPSGYAMTDFSNDLATFADAIGISGFILVGHSMGGAIAYQFAIDHGDRLKAVVFVTPAGADGLEPPTEAIFAEQAKRQADRAYSISVERKKKFYRPVPDSIYEQSAITLENTAPALLREGWWAMTNLRLGERLSEISVPALMIGADHDESIPLATVIADYERIPNCGLYVFARCNHWPLLEAPEEFAAVLTDFIASVNA